MIEFVDSLSECGNEVVYECWMVRCGGRRKIGWSFIHMRHSILQSRLLDQYKRNPQYNQVSFLSSYLFLIFFRKKALASSHRQHFVLFFFFCSVIAYYSIIVGYCTVETHIALVCFSLSLVLSCSENQSHTSFLCL